MVEQMETYAVRARAIAALCDNQEQTKVSLINPYLELPRGRLTPRGAASASGRRTVGSKTSPHARCILEIETEEMANELETYTQHTAGTKLDEEIGDFIATHRENLTRRRGGTSTDASNGCAHDMHEVELSKSGGITIPLDLDGVLPKTGGEEVRRRQVGTDKGERNRGWNIRIGRADHGETKPRGQQRLPRLGGVTLGTNERRQNGPSGVAAHGIIGTRRAMPTVRTGLSIPVEEGLLEVDRGTSGRKEKEQRSCKPVEESWRGEGERLHGKSP